jgi:K+-transporting ATPase ATPase C chain
VCRCRCVRDRRQLHGAQRRPARPFRTGPVVPASAVTDGGSGLDPHISPAYADLQVPRVARERGRTEHRVREMITEHTDGRALGFLGEPGVDVLELNLALDGS